MTASKVAGMAIIDSDGAATGRTLRQKKQIFVFYIFCLIFVHAYLIYLWHKFKVSQMFVKSSF